MKKLNIANFIIVLSIFVIGVAFASIQSCNFKLNKEHPQIKKGEILYNKHCKECHGDDARGADALRGHYKKLDLTLINVRRDLDQFPVDEIAKYIDGRNHYKEFGPREMPMWGVDMMAKEQNYSPDTARTNLAAIVSYLIKIQR